MGQGKCSLEECDIVGRLRVGLCDKHYAHHRIHGDPRYVAYTAPETRFWPKVNKNGPIPEQRPDLGPCWVWLASKSPKGYGLFTIRHKHMRAHRVAYEWAKGAVPAGLTLDHLCRNRACVNPDHLEAVTVRVNTLRGVGIVAVNARKTHCKYGHKFTPANTYVKANGGRVCRACAADYQRRRRKARQQRAA